MSRRGKAIINDAEASFFSPERCQAVDSWAEIAKYFAPSQYPVFSNSGYQGDISNIAGVSTLHTNEGILSSQMLSSTIQNTVMNEATKWVIPQYVDPSLNTDGEANLFSENAGDVFLSSLSNSNFYAESAKVVSNYCTFGTGVVIFDEKVDSNSSEFGGFDFKSLHLMQCSWYEGSNGKVERVYIKETLSVEVIRERYGKLSTEMSKVVKKDPTEKFNIVTAQLPVGGGLFELVTVDVQTGKVLRSIELKEQAVFVPRWSTMSGESIGYGCGHVATPDIRVLNLMRFEHLQSKALVNRPPILSEQDNILGELSLKSGAISYVSSVDGIKAVNLGINPQSIMATEADYKDAVKRAFLLDKIALPPRTEIGEMSAYEVAHRLSEMGNVIAGEISRLYGEYLTLVASRGIGMLYRKNKLGELPQAVKDAKGIDFKFLFINPLARSRELEGVKSLQSAVQVLSSVQKLIYESSQSGSSVDVFSPERMPINVCRDLGVPATYLATQKEMKKAVEKAEQAEQLRQVAELNSLRSTEGG